MTLITRRLLVSAQKPSLQAIAEAAALIRAGSLVAFPTETVYGLGANALDGSAVKRIFSAKQRPATDPLIVHLARLRELPRVVAEVPPVVEQLAAAFWPGPLTLILPRGAAVPAVVTAGRETVAVRIPHHPVAQSLINAAGLPIAAPSANRFGHTSPTTAVHVLADLDGRLDMVLDAGPTPLGLESTVLDMTAPVPTVLRPGGVSVAALQAVLGEVLLGERTPELATAPDAPDAPAAPDEGARSPGLLERHYAPDADLWLAVGEASAALTWLAQQIEESGASGQRVGALLCEEDIAALLAQSNAPDADALLVDIEPLGSAHDLLQMAHRLYAALRALDARHPDVILARDFGTEGLALAIRDRLTRAASGRVVQV
jgi:L-threonylcarbamoyladenylate synthase